MGIESRVLSFRRHHLAIRGAVLLFRGAEGEKSVLVWTAMIGLMDVIGNVFRTAEADEAY